MRYAPTVGGNTFRLGETLPRSGGTFSQAGKPCRIPGERFPRREKLAAFRGNIFPGGKTLPRYGGTFSQAGKPCRVPGEHFPRRENLAAFQGNIFPGGKTLPRSGGTFSQAGKPCRAPGEHFPGREKLAAFRGNIFPGGKTLPRSGGTFSRAGKPCRDLFCSLTSGRMRYAPTLVRSITSWWFIRRYRFVFVHMRAYAIRPYSYLRFGVVNHDEAFVE